ncbi:MULTISPECIES: hypothetical protein [unclassified Nodularia (in: cyanobacteria)]|nr:MULTISPECIES: hypothetical protein [unclassified Nodularia (in: cyanobacteria)]
MPDNSGIYNPGRQYIVLLENKQLSLATLAGFFQGKHDKNYPHG